MKPKVYQIGYEFVNDTESRHRFKNVVAQDENDAINTLRMHMGKEIVISNLLMLSDVDFISLSMS
jgi:hypothetical protein